MLIQEIKQTLNELITLHVEHGEYVDKINELRKSMKEKGSSIGIVSKNFLYSNEEGTYRVKFDEDGDLELLHHMKSLEEVLTQEPSEQPE